MERNMFFIPGKKLSNIWLALCCTVSVLSALGTENVPVFTWFKTDRHFTAQDYRLLGYKFAERNHVYTLMQCMMYCFTQSRCQSFNYLAGSATCELNSEIELLPQRLVPHVGYVYATKESYVIDFGSTNACARAPCSNGGQCLSQQQADGSLSYNCLCGSQWAGQSCSHPVSAPTWSAWSEWGACSVSCGEGWQRRTRDCLGADAQVRSSKDCQGLYQEERQCPGLLPCPRWDGWSPWSVCSASSTCGLGRKVRTRNCLYGGVPGIDRMCMGYFIESTPCRQPSCDTPVKVGNGTNVGEGWLSVYNDIDSTWGDVCGDGWTQQCADTACHQIGYQKGSTAIGNKKPSSTLVGEYHLSDITCLGNESSLVKCVHSDWGTNIHCMLGTVYLQCIVDGGWNSWSEWGECSVTCAKGIRLRHRSCDYPNPQRGGTECLGKNEESKPCVMDSCPVDGEWLLWTDWGECNTTCGGGSQQRTRECNLPKHGGQTCTGESDQWRACNTHHCPIGCVWDAWSPWGECSTTCGGGMQQRDRETVGPFYGGENCTGEYTEGRGCNNHSCPIDCEWNSWLDWQACDVTCGWGEQVRLREPFGPFYGGANCTGNTDDWRNCNEQHCPVDCVWNTWGDWGGCNMTCGGGWQYKERTEGGPYYGGENCTGGNTDWRTCNEHACPVDCVWSVWGVWSACNTTCGGGWRQRARGKEGPQYGGEDCEGEAGDWSVCGEEPCPVNGYWLTWSAWTECSETCANGTQHRTRSCVEPLYGGLECEGNQTHIQDCFVRHCPVAGEWRVWGVWSLCTHTCGAEGTQYRTRTCSEPQYGGEDCVGSDRQTQTCNQLPCPENGFWKAWATWSECTVSCGGGDTVRRRECVPALHGGENCTGEWEETDYCNTQPCPVAGYWEDWTTWDVCSEHCGGGFTSRSRHCVEPLHGGLECEGPANETKTCNDEPCPDDCFWLSWSEWSECNRTCGGGYQTRERGSVGPLHGGQNCTGEPEDWRLCNKESCAIDCVWMSWEPWEPCNATCGGGLQWRHRGKDGPYYGGDECSGSADEPRDCNTHPCPVDCEWEVWTDWMECSVTCGGGTQDRHRDTSGPLYGGQNCTGDTEETQSCNSQPCPIDCEWDAWQTWDACSVSCGGGEQSRQRGNQGPHHGGVECTGNSTEVRGCNMQHCPVPGYWSSWGEWSQCTLTCGGGSTERHRECVPPLYGGENCTGDSEEVTPCNIQPCPIPGEWLPWSSWSLCSVTCGGGVRSRSRDCNTTSYGDLTDPCIGATQDNDTCHEFDCVPLGVTCSDYVERGLVDSNWVEIDPDGTYGNPAFTVFCDNSGEDKGITVINHQYQNTTTVSGYEGPGEFQAPLVYQDKHGSPISVDQLIALVDSSKHCKQFVRWECLSAAFNPDKDTLEAENTVPYKLTYWENRWGEMMNYWGGALPDINPPSMTCGCSMTQTCLNPSHLCNCDTNNINDWRVDEGWLTVKYDLPVTSFRAGDTGDAGLEIGKFVVGPLICNGTEDNSANYWFF